ncbi:MAG: hypothetical protein AAFX06_33215 [Planctomycetota bacterium]
MTINYLADVKPLEDAGQTDAEIATALATLTVRDMPVEALRLVMRERKLWLKDPISRARDRGKIGVAMTGAGFPAALYDGLVEFEAALYDMSATHVSTASRIDIAGEVAQVIGGLRALGVVTAEDAEAFYTVGGGMKYPDVNAAAIAAARQEHADEVVEQSRMQVEQSRMRDIDALRARIENDFINPAMDDGSSTAADVQAAIKAGL